MTKLGEIKVAFRYTGIERQKTYVTVSCAAGELIIKTSVKRAVDDVYDKALGRFLAFKKAMYMLTIENLITREQRRQAWMAYRESIKVPAKINLGLVKRAPKIRLILE